MHDAEADDELPPVIGERYVDVLAERAIALLDDYAPEPPVTRSARLAGSGLSTRLKRSEAIVAIFERGFKRAAGVRSDRRRAELAKIHILAHQAGLDRETYEAMLSTVASVTSSAALDAFGRGVVIQHLQRCLGQSPRHADAHRADAPHNLGSKPLLAKIEALLSDGDKPWAYADALARRICHKDRLAFCGDAELRKIVAALSYDQQRRQRRESESSDA